MAELAARGHRGRCARLHHRRAPATTARRPATYTPTLTAAPAELIGIAEAIGASGTGVLQVVSDFLDVDDEFATLPRDGRRVGPAAVDLAGPQPDAARRVPLDPRPHHRRQRRRGDDDRPGRAPRGRPDPRPRVHAQPVPDQPRVPGDRDAALADKVSALRDPLFRQRLFEASTSRDTAKLGGSLISRYDLLFEMGDAPDYEPRSATRSALAPHASGAPPTSWRSTSMLAGDGHGLLYLPFLNYVDGNARRLPRDARPPAHRPRARRRRRARRHDLRRQLPDHAARLLGSRPRPRPDPAAVPRAAPRRDTARTVGLLDRGVLAPGYRADVNVIDFDRPPPAQADDRARPARRRPAPAAARRRLAATRSSPAR